METEQIIRKKAKRVRHGAASIQFPVTKTNKVKTTVMLTAVLYTVKFKLEKKYCDISHDELYVDVSFPAVKSKI